MAVDSITRDRTGASLRDKANKTNMTPIVSNKALKPLFIK